MKDEKIIEMVICLINTDIQIDEKKDKITTFVAKKSMINIFSFFEQFDSMPDDVFNSMNLIKDYLEIISLNNLKQKKIDKYFEKN